MITATERILKPALQTSLVLILLSPLACQQPPPGQHGFASPREAAGAFVAAASEFDAPTLRDMLGPNAEDLIASEDTLMDKHNACEFAELAAAKLFVEPDSHDSTRAIISVGPEDWPLPIPLMMRRGMWYFDTEAGRTEILHRRIGANELTAIQICRGFVEAQHENSELACQITGLAQYAQRIISTPGRRDGL
jgi:hypothetical protein